MVTHIFADRYRRRPLDQVVRVDALFIRTLLDQTPVPAL